MSKLQIIGSIKMIILLSKGAFIVDKNKATHACYMKYWEENDGKSRDYSLYIKVI